ncbi:MAG: cysteine peptidase family C39 domain-containing protein [Patescibacteria group bacterium]
MRLRLPYYHQINDYSCGPAVVQMILKYYGLTKSQRSLIRLVGTNERVGTTRKKLILGFKKFSLETKVVFSADFTAVKEFLKNKIPVIVSYCELDSDQEHYAIVTGLTKKDVIFQDPWLGSQYRLDRRNFMLRWHNQKKNGKFNGWLLAAGRWPAEKTQCPR